MRAAICVSAGLLACVGALTAEAKPESWLSNTTWTFLDDGTTVRESIDSHGGYVMSSADGKHLDHGTLVIRNGKVCHTSLMSNDGEVCWIVPHARIGQTVTAVSPKGRKLKVTRVAYLPQPTP
jgi:hypothetical protein